MGQRHLEDRLCESCGRTYVLTMYETDMPSRHNYNVKIVCPNGHEVTLNLSDDFQVTDAVNSSLGQARNVSDLDVWREKR